MNIRLGTIEDLPEVQRLNQALVNYEREFVLHGQSINADWAYQPEGVAHFTKYLKPEPNVAVFIAEAGGTVAGYLAASCSVSPHRNQNPVADIETMFVSESHRGQGLGTKLVNAFTDWAREQGAIHHEVMAWSGNRRTLSFYRRHGFVEDAVRLTRPAQP